MHPEEFTYPPYSIPLVEAYEGHFESVFIMLHPFIRVPEELAWSVTRSYPADAQIEFLGRKELWTEVAAQTGLNSCARVNQALLTSIGSLDEYLRETRACEALHTYLQCEPVWMPTEGRFEPLLQPDLLCAFDIADCGELIYIPEFPQSEKVVRLTMNELRGGLTPFPSRGTLLAPDASFLFTVDWDSFFTLFYGKREFLRNFGSAFNIEGFFATPNTEHNWFNYSFGCATVTLSPEHWQTV